MARLITDKSRVTSIILAWLIFIGIDFLFHASLFAGFWEEDLPALKTLNDLALLIPAGYFSFLLLTTLIGLVFFKVFSEKPSFWTVSKFGLIFAGLFSLSNALGLYSYIDLPLKQILVFNLVYFVEIISVTLFLYHFSFNLTLRKAVGYTALIFIGLVIVGVLIQNML